MISPDVWQNGVSHGCAYVKPSAPRCHTPSTAGTFRKNTPTLFLRNEGIGDAPEQFKSRYV